MKKSYRIGRGRFTGTSAVAPTLVLLFLGLLLASQPIVAQSLGGKEEGFLSKVSFHGHLNQGFGITDGFKYRGVTDDGTADLRTAAFQARFAATQQDTFILQLAHESVGTSPTNELRDDLEFDWLFYRRNFNNGLELKVGRVPLPIGIYNEIKDAGVALPFCRPSGNYYGEGTWTSDTVDGVVLSKSFATASPWQVDAHLYGGSWKRIETSGSTLSVGEADIDNALGMFVWVHTPIEGLRFGLGYNRFDATGGLFLAPGAEDSEETRAFSIDGTFDRFSARFEISRREFTGGYWQPYYFEFTYQLNERWRLMAMRDVGDLLFEIPFFATFDDSIEKVWAVGVSYALKPNIVFKLENQWVEGFGQIEDQALNFFFDEPVEVNLSVLSVALAF